MLYVEYCLWLVLYIIWISQLTCVKCPLPPKMCCLASSWFASCLSNCAPMFFHFHTFWNHQFSASEECSIEICYSPHGAESVSYFWIMQRHRPHVPQLLNSFLISFSMSCLLHPSWVQLYICQWKGGLFQTSHKQLSIIHTEENIVSNPHRSKLEYQYQSQCECLWVCIMCICVVCPFLHTLSVSLICCLSPT